ncbi:BMP family ABC transporter substrate-binding protein [Virgisporangium aliadipatigenens]|uniref:BMP family ABC transporter substrate-binding protein n=1 Tax=Virgisporangium aliadipatigenens TaxID=741659 RepID=A0A8J4DVR1_9ACTN|nr:BMP family ABC transporter substrate-binding protein [Virgisporangium aliadipatigenens]GIJ50382.1 BMP family ABC transporter substrate-binding protein [Virgisporangium aliadipatigenens]
MRLRRTAAAVATALVLAGCGTATNDSLAGPVSAGLGTEEIRVGLAFDSGGRGDKSFNDAAAAGLDLAVNELGVAATEAAPKADTDPERTEVLRALAKAGNNPVIAVGFLYGSALRTVAAEFPKTTFAIVDDDSFAAPNVVSLVFAEEQGSYLVGVAAALRSRTDRIGFIGGVRNPLLQKFEAGFAAGARRVKPGIVVDVNYLSVPPDFSGFGVPDRARGVAAGMLAAGVDIVYAAAGGSGAGALQAVAAVDGAAFVGVDSDQYLSVDAAVRPVVLTSMIKRVDNAVFQEIQGFIKGDRAGGVKRFDLKIDGVGYAGSNETAIVPLRAQLEAARQQLIDGTVVAPATP